MNKHTQSRHINGIAQGGVLPMTIVENRDDNGRPTYSIQYADGRTIHKGYTAKGAEAMLDRLAAHVAGSRA